MGWKWQDIRSVPQNGLKVFSTFSCGGGSSMGYKLAGYEVIGNCEIDPQIAEMYKKNHHPRLSYVMDIREFRNLPSEQLPDELLNLDILDGSPPCSVFSLAGKRERDWGKTKKFKEGQAEQTLDDLFFEFIALTKRLKPKVFIAENVKGLIVGNAKGYVHEIIRGFDEAGYTVQMFCLNAAKMGVPQKRQRVFFIGHRKELPYPKLKLEFNEPVISFGSIRAERGKPISAYKTELLRQKIRSDSCVADINQRLYHRTTEFNSMIVWDNAAAPTITSNGQFYRACDDMALTDSDFIRCQTFPIDYDFNGMNVQYVCGMSVPPVMMKCIAREIAVQWFQIP